MVLLFWLLLLQSISNNTKYECDLSFHQPLQLTQKQDMNHLQLLSMYTETDRLDICDLCTMAVVTLAA